MQQTAISNLLQKMKYPLSELENIWSKQHRILFQMIKLLSGYIDIDDYFFFNLHKFLLNSCFELRYEASLERGKTWEKHGPKMISKSMFILFVQDFIWTFSIPIYQMDFQGISIDLL